MSACGQALTVDVVAGLARVVHGHFSPEAGDLPAHVARPVVGVRQVVVVTRGREVLSYAPRDAGGHVQLLLAARGACVGGRHVFAGSGALPREPEALRAHCLGVPLRRVGDRRPVSEHHLESVQLYIIRCAVVYILRCAR